MAQDTESTILEVARKHFVQNGYAGARTQEIADEAGINKAMVHYYFRTKEKLYQEVVVHTLNQLIPKIAKAMESDGTFEQRLEKIVATYIDVLTEQPDIPFFIMSELSQKRERFVEELKKRSSNFPSIYSFIAQMMEDMEAGKIRAMPPHHLLLNIISMTVFPFMAKPVFLTLLDLPEESFRTIMEERKVVIIDFIKHALRVG